MDDERAVHRICTGTGGNLEDMSTEETTPGAGRPAAGPQYTWSPDFGPAPQTQPVQPGPAASYGHGGWAPPLGPTTTVLTADQSKPQQRRIPMILLASAMSAVIGAGAGVGTYALNAEWAPAHTIAVSSAPVGQSAVLDGTVAAAAAKITPSVVTITVEGQRASGIGTGIVLDSAGHIVTNHHVVAAGGSGATITVTFTDGRTARATVVGAAPSSDLAVIKVDAMSNLTPATFANSASVVLGQAVVAAGAPLGLSDTVTSGVVSATARPVRSGPVTTTTPSIWRCRPTPRSTRATQAVRWST